MSQPGRQLVSPHPPGAPAVSRGRRAARVLWALLPLLTLGFAAGPVFWYAAARLRSWVPTACGFGYLAATVTGFTLESTSYNVTTPLSVAGAWIWLPVVPVVSCAHAFVIRRRVFDRPPLYATADFAAGQSARRDQARKLLARNPELARKLAIGRPDLSLDRFDDGGLLDVNHVPAEFFVTALGFDGETADRITGTRESLGRFDSARELAIQADLPYDLIDNVKDRLLFL